MSESGREATVCGEPHPDGGQPSCQRQSAHDGQHYAFRGCQPGETHDRWSADREATPEPVRCGRCAAPIRPNAGRFPNRGPWLDVVDWSVCDYTRTPHAPASPPAREASSINEETS